jgi:hypothetical protein
MNETKIPAGAMRLAMSTVTGAIAVLCVVWGLVPADGFPVFGRIQLKSSTHPAVPHVTSTEAIAYLNEQRAANGIPGNLVDDTELSQGCLEYTNNYVPTRDQYPHEELPTQPGYSAAGDRAAASSDLAYRSPGFPMAWWGPETNPWLNAPIHLAGLFKPTAEAAWYGESSHAACMDAGPSLAQPFSAAEVAPTPTFYSYPGAGVKNVATSWNAGEAPFTPGEAVGIRQGTETGPYILLWAVGGSSEILSAALVGPRGEDTPIKLVPPSTPAPPSPGNFPQETTVGAYGNVTYVIPPRPLKADSSYALTAQWKTYLGQVFVQTASFQTGTQTEGEKEISLRPPKGQILSTLTPRTLRLASSGVALGQVVGVSFRLCHGNRFAPRCPARQAPAQQPWRRALPAEVAVAVPRALRGKHFAACLSIAPFTVSVGPESFSYPGVDGRCVSSRR